MDTEETTSTEKTRLVSTHSNGGFIETEEEFSPNIENNTTIKIQESTKLQDDKESAIKYGAPILWAQLLAGLTSSISHLGVAVVMGYTGITLPSMMDPTTGDLILNKNEASIFSSVIYIGALFGSLCSGLISAQIGHRMSLLVFLPIGIVSWLILSFSYSFMILVLSRVIQGIAIGVIASCSNNYVSEIAHSSIRGRLVGLNDLFRQIGYLYLCLIGSTQLTWRNVGLVCGLSSFVIPFVCIIFLPNSPRWLATHGRNEEAVKSLIFFRGLNYNINFEISEIIKQLNNNNHGKNLLDQFKMLGNKKILKILSILAALLFATCFTGNTAVVNYGVSIFQLANVSINSYLSTVITNAARVVGAIIYILISDRLARKGIYMLCVFLSGVCMISLGMFFYLKNFYQDLSHIQWLPLLSLILFTVFTSMSMPILALLRSELMPTAVRSLGVGILYSVFFVSSFAASFSYPYMVDLVGSHWTFWIYSVIAFAMVIITALFIPETRGKSLEEIADNLYDKK